MKRDYDTPKAEKVEFDYKESVVACSDYGSCNTDVSDANRELGDPYYKCSCTPYFN